MASLKRSNTFHTLPPSYQEHDDVELGAMPRIPEGIKFHQTGSTMNSGGGYQDYHPNAPHDPNHPLACDDRLRPAKRSTRRKMLVSVWHLGLLYAAIVLLVALLALCGGMHIAKRWFEVRTELVINGVAVNGSTLWVSSPSSAPMATKHPEVTTEISTDVQTIVHTITPEPATSTETVQLARPISTPRLTVSITTQYTVTVPPTGSAAVTTKTILPKDPNDTDQTATKQDSDMTVTTVTPQASITTSVALLTTTLDAPKTPPPVTSTLVSTKV